MKQLLSLGQRIREFRLGAKMTQFELSKDICTPSMISQVEADRARPSVKMLGMIADRLHVTIESLLLGVSHNLEPASAYKAACAMVASKDYANAIPLLEGLLSAELANLSATDIRLRLGTCHVHLKDFGKAERLLNEVRPAAAQLQDARLLVELSFQQGMLEFFRKRIPLAAYHFEQARKEASQLPQRDPFLESRILNQLGLVQMQMGMVQDSIDTLRLAADIHATLGNFRDAANIYLNLGMSYRKLQEYETAAVYSEKAAIIFEMLEEVLGGIRLQVTLALLRGKEGRIPEAVPMLEEAASQFRELGEPAEEGAALVELSHLFLLQDQAERAKELCLQAESLLPEDHACRARILFIRGQITAKQGEPEEAVRLLTNAADRFLQRDQLGDWEAAMHEVAEIRMGSGDFRDACGILQEIRVVTRQRLFNRGITL